MLTSPTLCRLRSEPLRGRGERKRDRGVALHWQPLMFAVRACGAQHAALQGRERGKEPRCLLWVRHCFSSSSLPDVSPRGLLLVLQPRKLRGDTAARAHLAVSREAVFQSCCPKSKALRTLYPPTPQQPIPQALACPTSVPRGWSGSSPLPLQPYSPVTWDKLLNVSGPQLLHLESGDGSPSLSP